MHIGTHVDVGQTAKGDSIHLVQRGLGVAAARAATESGTEPYLRPDLDTPAGAEALEQKLVQQAGADECRVKCRNIAEIVVVSIQFHARNRIDAERGEVTPQSRARRCGNGIAAGSVQLR